MFGPATWSAPARWPGELETGDGFINGITASNPRVPVGGIKNSEYGRKLSHFDPHAFVNTQIIWIEAEFIEGNTDPKA